MNKKFLTCSGSLVLIIVVVIVGGIAGFNLIRDSFRTSVLQELGFASQAEYNDFTAKLNETFDETYFYLHTFGDAEKLSVKEKLTTAIAFADGAQLFLESGYLNIDALEKDDNASLVSAVEFTDKEYSYFAQLLLVSIYNADKENNAVLNNYQIISLVVNADGTHTLVMKLSTADMKNAMKTYGSSLPNSLFLKIDYSIKKNVTITKSSEIQSVQNELVVTADNTYATTDAHTLKAENASQIKEEYKVVSAKMQINALNENYNDKCNTFLNKVFGTQDAAAEFAKVFIMLTNAFDTAITANTTFAHDSTQII